MGRGAHVYNIRFEQVRNMKTLGEALEVFTKEEVVSFKWDKEVNADTGALNDHTPKNIGCFFIYTSCIYVHMEFCVYLFVWPHRGVLFIPYRVYVRYCLSVWPHCVVLVLFFVGLRPMVIITSLAPCVFG